MKSFFRSPSKRKQYSLLFMDFVAIALSLFLSLEIQLISQGKLASLTAPLRGLSLPSQLFAVFNLFLLFAVASTLIFAVYVLFAYVLGVYEIDVEFNWLKKAFIIWLSLLLSVSANFFFLHIVHGITLTTSLVISFVVTAMLLMLGQRFLFYFFSKNNAPYRVLVLHKDHLADKAVEALSSGVNSRHFLFEYRGAEDILQLNNAGYNLIVYPFAKEILSEHLIHILKAKFKGISTCNSLIFYIMSTGRFPAFDIYPRWFLDLSVGVNLTGSFQKRIKRAVDIGLSLIGLVASLPLMAVIAVLIKKTSPGPVFFTHERLGLHEKPFLIHKFRTMRLGAEDESGPVWAQKSDPRVTSIGKILRKTRMDELPQLFNVLKGDMSFVGPRPIRKFFADKLSQQFPFYFMRFYIRPGLTGWAQVSGGYGEDVEGQLIKLEYELFYLQEYTLLLDAVIILKTIKKVFWAQGQ